MEWKVLPSSRATATVRSKGILGALEHEVTFTAPAPAIAVGVASEGGAIDVPIEASIDATSFAPPPDASRFDREKMLDNLRGDEVLDAKRWPSVTFRGRYRGDLASGTLSGDLIVRGAPRAIAFDVVVTKHGDGLQAEASWTGTLTALGIKPFKALFGALRLHDFCAIRLAIDLAV